MSRFRLSLDLLREDHERLCSLETLQGQSKTEVIRRALKLYDLVTSGEIEMTEKKSGKIVIIL